MQINFADVDCCCRCVREGEDLAAAGKKFKATHKVDADSLNPVVLLPGKHTFLSFYLFYIYFYTHRTWRKLPASPNPQGMIKFTFYNELDIYFNARMTPRPGIASRTSTGSASGSLLRSSWFK